MGYSYPSALKKKLVYLNIVYGIPVKKIADKYGVSVNSIYNWKKQYTNCEKQKSEKNVKQLKNTHYIIIVFIIFLGIFKQLMKKSIVINKHIKYE